MSLQESALVLLRALTTLKCNSYLPTLWLYRCFNYRKVFFLNHGGKESPPSSYSSPPRQGQRTLLGPFILLWESQ